MLDGLTNAEKLGLAGSPYPSVAELLEDCRAAVVQAVVDARPAVRDQAAYDALRAEAARDHEAHVRAAMADVMRVLDAWRRAEKALSGRAEMALLPALTDMRAQLERLVHRGFVGRGGSHPAAPLPDVPRGPRAAPREAAPARSTGTAS